MSAKAISKATHLFRGQIQQFRNSEQFNTFLAKNNIVVDAFTDYDVQDLSNIRRHNLVIGRDLFKKMRDCRFLILLDNNSPYDNYLPSKVFSYVGFTKPIIVLTNNIDSAIIRFLNSHSDTCIIHLNDETAANRFNDFVRRHLGEQHFNNSEYNKYQRFTISHFASTFKEKIVRKVIK